MRSVSFFSIKHRSKNLSDSQNCLLTGYKVTDNKHNSVSGDDVVLFPDPYNFSFLVG